MSPATGTIADLTPPESKFEFKATRPVVARARVIRPPVDKNDSMTVALNNYSSTQEYKVEAGRWSQASTGLPQASWTCVVLFDDDGDIWISRWDDVQDNSEPDNIVFNNPATDGSKGYILWVPDTKLYRSGANSLAMDDARMFIRRTSVSSTAFAARVIGEGNDRLVIRADGRILTGPGSTGATDLNLYRESVGTVPESGWKTDQHLMVGTSQRVGVAQNKQYGGAFSSTQVAGVIAKLGEMVVQGNSNNLTIDGYVRVQTGASIGIVRFVVVVRTNTVPSKNITVYNYADPGQAVKPKVRAWEDTTTGRVVLGFDWNTGTIQNASWHFMVAERADYNYWVPNTGFTVLDATALTGLTEITATNFVLDPVAVSAGIAKISGAFLNIERANYADTAIWINKIGNPNYSLHIAADGSLVWGDGTAAGDLVLGRGGAGVMSLTGAFQGTGDINSRIAGATRTVIGDMGGKPGVGMGTGIDTMLTREAAGVMKPNTGFARPIVTSLPGSPVDGQECLYLADATNGVLWHFVYRAASSAWLFAGGSSLFSKVATQENHSSTTYAALTTAGPSITVPLAGDYLVEVGSRAMNNTASGSMFHSFDVGGTAAADADSANHLQQATTPIAPSSVASTSQKTGLAASTALVSKYKVTAGQGAWERRYMRVTPIKVT